MKKLIYKEGNLLLAKNVDVVFQSCNCQNTFGSGIARSIKEMYPEAYAADTKAARLRGNRLGNFSHAQINSNPYGSSIKHVINLYGQNLGTDYNKLNDRKTDYEALYTAMEHAGEYLMDSYPGLSIGLPFYMGSALGGGRWEVVERLVEIALENYPSDVYVYKFAP